MINSMITIGGHLTNRIMCNPRGAPMELPNLTPSLYQFRLKLIDISADEKPVQVYPNVTSLSASIGLIYAEPRAGTFKLRYGAGPTTDTIDCRENPEDFKTKLAALAGSTTYGLDVVYQPTPSTWVCRFNSPPEDPGPPPVVLDIGLNGYENELEPETFVRVRQFTQNAETWVEIRLLQGPIASTNDHGSVLGAAPFVDTIRDGFTEDDGITEIKVNEIQAITVPADFTGTFTIKYQGRQSSVLSPLDGPQVFEDTLNLMYGDGIKRFVVTNPEVNRAYVEFVGPFAGFDMDPLAIEVTSEGKSDTAFEINLYTTEVAEALRSNAEVEAIFEIRLHITDPAFEDDPGQDLVLFQKTVRIVRPLHWEGLEEAAPINWLYPPNPKDYIPYTQDQVIVGVLTKSVPFGNGTLFDYSIAHDFNTSNLQVSVRENLPGPLNRQLRDDEFSVNFDDENALTIHIEGGVAPPTDSLIAIIQSNGPVEAFLAHHHTIAQINGLQEIIDSILRRLAALEALLPSFLGASTGTSPFGSSPDDKIVTMAIKDEWDLIPTNRPPGSAKFDPSKLASPGVLLPAVHDVIELGVFTANPADNVITLAVAHTLVAGQRVRIYDPPFTLVGECTFTAFTGDTEVDLVNFPGHGLVNDRKVKFSGGELPEAISPHVVYYVISSTADNFQISVTLGGPALPLLTNGDVADHFVYKVAEVPGGLLPEVDYFALAPITSTTFKLSETIGGPEIEISSAGFAPVTMSTVEELVLSLGVLPPPGPASGNVYSVRDDIFLRGISGVRSETVHPGDLVASDGRMWYHVTRSDSPGSNSFYANQMEKEIFQVAINENMLPAGTVFTLKFDLSLQMFKHNTDVQFLLVVEIADLPGNAPFPPAGPNLFDVEWNKTPLLQQRIIVTDILTTHPFGAQVLHRSDGTLRTNKKQYGVEVAGDVIPSTPIFGMRVRLIEFDTEDIIDLDPNGTTGLIYWSLERAQAGVTRGTPTSEPTTTILP